MLRLKNTANGRREDTGVMYLAVQRGATLGTIALLVLY